MTTKEFIKILEEADPTGNAHIRMEGGIPLFAELKPGYWDGPYKYIDENGNFVLSSKGDKVDIYCLDIFDFVERQYNFHDPERNTWEYIQSHFKCDLTYCIQEQNEERFAPILKEAKEAFDDIVEMEQRMWEKELDDAIKHAEEGWTWFQNKEVDNKELKFNSHYYYTWKIYDKNGKDQGSNVYNTIPVLKSGLFEKSDNNVKKGYYQWIYKK